MSASPRYRRRNKLPKPRLQLKVVLVFLGVGLLCTTLEFALITHTLFGSGVAVPPELPLAFLRDLLWTSLLAIPLTLVVGTLVTFRIAGPIYRFERYLAELAAGRDPGRCRIRKGDELQELCLVLNEAVTALRRGQGAGPGNRADETAEGSGANETNEENVVEA